MKQINKQIEQIDNQTNWQLSDKISPKIKRQVWNNSFNYNSLREVYNAIRFQVYIYIKWNKEK